jgi:hypothetical protein
MDAYGPYAGGAVEELAHDDEGGLGVAALEREAPEVGEHDRPGPLPVQAVDHAELVRPPKAIRGGAV